LDLVSRENRLIMDKYAAGTAEGKAEGKAEIAINMLKANRPMDEIILFTGLSKESIMKLII